ncbi:beta-propeller fold lactonase family protein [Actinomadura rubrisoli]|uniref:beta-propeller fold lactonase family protein n=1 Tax=Actinomadura rubrisoli TaxID=2530368 RepID=UPI0014048FAE|nr:beta-propeller fold lactonase family protein [Actinomadura rubrisoli]
MSTRPGLTVTTRELFTVAAPTAIEPDGPRIRDTGVDTKSIRHPATRVATAVLVTATTLTATAHQATADPAPRPRALYTTNGGTADISTFTIGPDGRLTRLDPPVKTGDDPRGIALTPDGRTAYAVSNGQVGVYAVDAQGRLSPRGRPEPTGPTPFGVAVRPNGRTLYVTDHDDGTVSVFTIGGDGTLTRLGRPVPVGGDTPNGVAASTDGRFLFVSEGVPLAGNRGRLFTFSIGRDGALTPLGDPIVFESAGEGLSVTPDGRFVYLTTTVTDQIFGFRLSATGALTPVPGSPFQAPARPVGAAPTPDSRALYVTVGEFGTTPNGVWGFRIAADGSLTRVEPEPFASGAAPIWATATPDGRRVYAVNRDSGDVSGYDIAAGNALRPVPDSPFPTGGTNALLQSIVVRPDQGPRAAFTAVPSASAVKFDASASADLDGKVVRYGWDFGDGTVRPDGGPTPSHRYGRPGTFTVTLTVTDDEGCSTRLVFTGQTALCNGSPAATAHRTITVTR